MDLVHTDRVDCCNYVSAQKQIENMKINTFDI